MHGPAFDAGLDKLEIRKCQYYLGSSIKFTEAKWWLLSKQTGFKQCI